MAAARSAAVTGSYFTPKGLLSPPQAVTRDRRADKATARANMPALVLMVWRVSSRGH